MKHVFIFLVSFFSITQVFSQQTVGMFYNQAGSADGYVLFAPLTQDTTYLIDKCGHKIHQWASDKKPGLCVYLMADGSLLHTSTIASPAFGGNAATGGRIERLDWNGNLLWQYTVSDSLQTQSHDVFPMPNGNILLAVWEIIKHGPAIAAGRNPALLSGPVWSAKVMELQPAGTDSAVVVWQWRLFEHLVQEFDSTKANYGVVAEHPELVNFNYTTGAIVDWIHLNAVAYNERLDQVIISAHSMNELWVVDHSSTTAEAASHTGGAHGKGGDLLYRWGNPAAYNRGDSTNRVIYFLHSAHWIPDSLHDGGKIMYFNNGQRRPDGNYSSVDIITPPVDSAGNYFLAAGQKFGPDSLTWTYRAQVDTSFYSPIISGAQRLSNGNTIICEGIKGNFFEIDSAKNTVWKYVCPVDVTGILTQGNVPFDNYVFRSPEYSVDYPAFSGRNLTAGLPVEINPLADSCGMITVVREVKNSNTEINVYPNPSSTGSWQLTVGNESMGSELEIFDIQGRLILKSKTETRNPKIEMDVAPGMYFLMVQTKDGVRGVKMVRE